MSLTRVIAHNTIIQIIGKGAGLIFSILTLGLITRYLGPMQFGYYTTAFAFLQVFGILIDFGLQMITAQLISDPKEDEARMFSNIFTLRLTLAIIFFIAPLISLFFPYPNEVKVGIGITSITYICSTLSTVLVGLFQKHLLMKRVAFADFMSKFLFFLFSLFATYAHFGLISIFIVSAISQGVYVGMLYFFASKIIPIRFLVEKEKWKIIISRSWPIALSIALNLIYFKADTLILSLVKTQEEVGLYGAPYKILETLIGLSYLFLGLLLPLLTSSFAQNNMERFKNIVQRGFDSMAILSLPLIFGTFVLGKNIMVFIAGNDYAVSGEILKILVIAAGAIFIAAVFGYAIVAMNKQKQVIIYYGMNAIVSLVGYIIFIPLYSFWAAAWITVFSEIFILCFALWILYKNTKFIPRLTIFSKSLVASIIMAIALFFTANIQVLLSLAIGIIIYGLVLYGIKGVTKETIVEIIKIK